MLWLMMDRFEIGMVVAVIVFTIFFALLLNPPTRWVKRMTKKVESAKADSA